MQIRQFDGPTEHFHLTSRLQERKVLTANDAERVVCDQQLDAYQRFLQLAFCDREKDPLRIHT